jgi:hypothetical protein
VVSLPQVDDVGGETGRVAGAVVGVPETFDGLDRLGVAVLVAGPFQADLDQVLVGADHVGGMGHLPDLNQLEPLGLGDLAGVRHRGGPRLIKHVLGDQDGDQLPDVPLLGLCPVAEQIERPAAEIGPCPACWAARRSAR